MPVQLSRTLREYLQQKEQDFAANANNLWRISRPIHERQNRPDSNENGLVHVKAVEENIWRLLQTTTLPNKANNLGDFMPFELFLLSCAACCHDFDKALKSAFSEGFKHGEGSGDFVEKNMDKLGLTRPQANAISSVISIHDLNPDEFQKGLSKLKTNQASPVGSYNLQRLAVLLKAADILHCDNSRIPRLGIDADKLEGLDRKKYFCRYCTDGWDVDGTRIFLQASPSAEEEIEAVRECLGYMKNSEWPAISDALERHNFPHQLETEQDITMSDGGLKQDEKDRLNRYLKDVVAATDRINIQGIYSMSGAGREPIYFPIEQHYTPLKTMSDPARLEEAVGMIREDVRSAERVPLTNLLSSYRRLLIIGEPGGGKTTFLRLIACVLAKDALEQGEPARKLHLGLSLDEPIPIPILIRLSALAGTLKKGCPAVNGAGAWRVLLQTMEELFGKENSSLLQRLLDKGGCTVLLDGLDEEPDQSIRKQMVDVTNAVLHHWDHNLFVLSSRPFGYHAVAALKEMATAHIDSFGRDEILEFLNRWAYALFPDEEERNREAYLPELESAVLNMPRIRRMAKNPVMLTCLCVVHWNERKLPEGKADLLAAVLRWLLNAKEGKRRQRGYYNTFAEESFKALAWTMTSHRDGKQVRTDLTWAAEQLAVPFLDELGVQHDRLRKKGILFLEAEMLDSGIVEQAGSGDIKFWHYTFQEHYAARALAEKSDADGPDGWWQAIKPHLDDRQWDEVLDHFVGCLAWTGRRRLNLLVERVLRSADGSLTSLARAVGVLGRILRILTVFDYQPPARLGWEKARDRVMDIFTLEGASRVPVEQRIAAAEALGQAGDPRINSLAPEMLPVPGMEGVLLGRYSVTVAEYNCFIENNGYRDRQYWEEEWWNTRNKRGWAEPEDWDEQLEHQNWPVTGVSWYEAAAYCNWLAARTNLSYRLPREEEWEKAATNPNGEYPWGNAEPNSELLNFDENVGVPSPVGIYPAGAAPGGHLDMLGNVWEWNRDLYKKRGSRRVVRGGSRSNVARYCRSAVRNFGWPGRRSNSLGFRLSRSVSLGP
ncbi:MAG: SUMF1/EgtB/PvdO family nonheme iron enzyme [Deltaproteobacteria bacterium]|nr:SUMF1/EgtB/PvdO family nonheme iron enzyme [Deltaproteobacteria bacterium]MBW1938100.1 SUMF1/EgtB/PvdO family nonheme iron enzyme [Deltaproteobacteria bacterium]